MDFACPQGERSAWLFGDLEGSEVCPIQIVSGLGGDPPSGASRFPGLWRTTSWLISPSMCSGSLLFGYRLIQNPESLFKLALSLLLAISFPNKVKKRQSVHHTPSRATSTMHASHVS